MTVKSAYIAGCSLPHAASENKAASQPHHVQLQLTRDDCSAEELCRSLIVCVSPEPSTRTGGVGTALLEVMGTDGCSSSKLRHKKQQRVVSDASRTTGKRGTSTRRRKYYRHERQICFYVSHDTPYPVLDQQCDTLQISLMTRLDILATLARVQWEHYVFAQ
jgi:hypothetical protein